MYRKQQGFTLVEIAIVLVIIGLLLGGVLKGQELINSAKVKNFASDMRNISTFIYAYQDRFRSLPGDDPRTATNLPGAPVAASTPAPSAANQCGTACIGNAESMALGTPRPLPTNRPVSGSMFALRALPAGRPPACGRHADGSLLPAQRRRRPHWSNRRPGMDGRGLGFNFFVCMSGVQGRFVRQLDTTLDDGNTTTGTVRVLGPKAGGHVFATATFYQVIPEDDATLYTVCQAN